MPHAEARLVLQRARRLKKQKKTTV